MMQQNNGEKRELRVAMKRRREAVEPAHRVSWSQAACERISHLLADIGAANVMVYIGLRSELDTSALIEHCWRSGIAVAAPRCESDGATMTPYWIRCWDELMPGAFGIREPNPTLALRCDAAFVPNMVIVPGLAFDQSGGRLGYGAGFYDRYYDRLRGLVPSETDMPLWAGCCYETQIVSAVPMDSHDARMDAVVTEQHVYWSGRRSRSSWNR
ncbi:5-formyltetrahydrofolate cyclo-ligase [Paenibacillus sp. CCS19]|uniref:5-formyltetrahydrofolate cyclo-ligase n=1 Tax=Paenibacillus sp. CCS19 TaxID=3158387 RepID=UPI0025609427|nr:5-formyltetrahydrofolate cyclo-ligase [Paenibacillus cellulosilyticus]GMK42370.1 5-formyltetrahydrofolate cyclo-ligase [Paenibacillus cellulosilyticus]